METGIYLHHKRHLCAIVSSDKGDKFVDNIECFCYNCQQLIEEAKTGFDSFPFYDKYNNNDELFYERYSEIIDGWDDNYELLGMVYDGCIDFDYHRLEEISSFFSPLVRALKLNEFYGLCGFTNYKFTDDYFILTSGSEVLLCSNIKIPFEPNSSQKNLRQLLRTKIAELPHLNDCEFIARYGSTVSESCDIENALFYNIGSSSFNRVWAKNTKVYFRRLYPNEMACGEDIAYKYVYHYSWYPKYDKEYEWEKQIVCQWNKVPLGKINSSTKPFDYYRVLKENADLINCVCNNEQNKLGLKIQLYVPKQSKINVHSVMKSMIDGVICAFHKPQQIDAEIISRRLNDKVELFLSTNNTCLCERRYVTDWKNVVKWDPKDDDLDCVVIEPIMVEDEAFSFSGQIFSITR